MPAVFIHGVPDTYRVWDPLLQQLSRTDVVALALPGFDSPVPPDFTATKQEYVNWIIDQLEQWSEPIDLVGHDWGCILAVRVASLRPDLVRTWAAGGGPISKDYEWHELAKIFQAPGAGEEWMAKLDPKQFSERLEKLGVPADSAKQAAAHIDEPMKRCILRLYRSAVTVGSEWEPGLAGITSPGLVFWGISDEACPVEFADRLGRDAKARRVLKFDAGHWFLLQRPSDVARALEHHWKSADSK